MMMMIRRQVMGRRRTRNAVWRRRGEQSFVGGTVLVELFGLLLLRGGNWSRLLRISHQCSVLRRRKASADSTGRCCTAERRWTTPAADIGLRGRSSTFQLFSCRRRSDSHIVPRRVHLSPWFVHGEVLSVRRQTVHKEEVRFSDNQR